MPKEELNPDQQAGLEERNKLLKTYAAETGLEAHLTQDLLADHSLSLGTAKARLRDRGNWSPTVEKDESKGAAKK